MGLQEEEMADAHGSEGATVALVATVAAMAARAGSEAATEGRGG